MTDRDFKLLVREYFRAESRLEFTGTFDIKANKRMIQKRDDLEKRILSELERFTKEEIGSLPFKD